MVKLYEFDFKPWLLLDWDIRIKGLYTYGIHSVYGLEWSYSFVLNWDTMWAMWLARCHSLPFGFLPIAFWDEAKESRLKEVQKEKHEKRLERNSRYWMP